MKTKLIHCGQELSRKLEQRVRGTSAFQRDHPLSTYLRHITYPPWLGHTRDALFSDRLAHCFWCGCGEYLSISVDARIRTDIRTDSD